MDAIVSAACEWLEKGQAFVLATIIRHQGSTPRPAGTRMLISPNQDMVGTVGGGLLEAKTMEAAAQLGEGAPARFLTFDMTNQDAANMEMICGGRVQVLLDYIRPTDENRTLFTQWHTALSRGQKAMLVTVISGRSDSTHIGRVDHGLLGRDIFVQGRLALADVSWKRLSDLLEKAGPVQVLELEGYLVVADPGRSISTLYIFGAGHVARPTAHIADMVGFSVMVLDDRKEFARTDRFPGAAVHTLSSFDGVFDDLAVTPDCYIVIVTRGHLHDREVLAQALKTPAVYIGMIGSRRKRDAIFNSLLKQGFTEDDIERVHSPIGLTIGGDTPEEIAVSIVAELIAVRSGVAVQDVSRPLPMAAGACRKEKD